MDKVKQTIVLGGGCFWCTEAIFKQLKGVLSVTPGYSGGYTDEPSYEQVSSGETGHAEVIKVEFDSSQIPLNDLLEVFWETHDPTTLNRQGNDIGPQYRSAIFYINQKQKKIIEESLQNQAKKLSKPITTEVKLLEKFFLAEEYHIDYYAKNTNQPYCQLVISPKLQKLKKNFSNWLK